MYKDKIVVVTGSNRGVGRMVTEHFLKNGAIVIGLSKNQSDLVNDSYFHYCVDLGVPTEIADVFRIIAKNHKNLDIVINNAAVLTSQYSMIMPIKNALDMINVNLLGVFFVSRESAKLMRSRKNGRIINIGSMASTLEPMGDSLYAASKTGIISLANVMAKEFSSFNVTCNTLAITAIETDMLRQHSETAQEKIKEIISNMPIKRMAVIDDILNVIDFYSSDRSTYITAQTIFLGGIN